MAVASGGAYRPDREHPFAWVTFRKRCCIKGGKGSGREGVPQLWSLSAKAADLCLWPIRRRPPGVVSRLQEEVRRRVVPGEQSQTSSEGPGRSPELRGLAGRLEGRQTLRRLWANLPPIRHGVAPPARN